MRIRRVVARVRAWSARRFRVRHGFYTRTMMLTWTFSRRVIARSRVVRGAAALIALAVCGVASARMPAVLDRVAPGPAVIVAVRSLSEFDASSAELLGAMEARTLGTLSQALVAMGVRDGLDLRAPAAALLYNAEQPTQDDVLLLLPMADAALFLGNLKARDDTGVSRFTYAGQDYFARTVDGGLLALSTARVRVETFNAAPGHAAEHKAMIGPRGREIAERAHVIALGKPVVLRPLLERVLSMVATGVPAPQAGANEGLDVRSNFVTRFVQVASDEATGAIVGLEPGALGLRIDAAAAFADDSMMAKACQGGPGAQEDAQPLRMLPGLDYLFAGSTNTAHPGVRMLLDELGPGPAAVGPVAEAQRSIIEAMSEMSTASVAVYAPPSLMFGVLTRTVIAWDAPQPRSGGAMFQTWLTQTASTGPEAQRPKAQYAPGAQTIAGVKVDAWSLVPPAGSVPMMPVFFGAEGPSGFFAATERFGYLTWGRDAALMEAAIKAPAGEQSLQNDLMLSQISELLPRPRAFEWYLDVRPIVKQARGLLGPRAAALKDAPDELPPIGAAVVMHDGSLQVSAFIPAPLMKLGYALMNAPASAQGPRPAANGNGASKSSGANRPDEGTP